MKWLRNAGLALAGILLAVGFAILGRPARRAREAERRTEELLADGSEKALKKAVKENEKAEKLKVSAAEAAAAGKKAMDGVKDEEIAAVISKWTQP